MLQKIRRFMKGRRGQGVVEYSIMLALIAIGSIGVFTLFGNEIRNIMGAIGIELSGTTATMAHESGFQDSTTIDRSLSDFHNDQNDATGS